MASTTMTAGAVAPMRERQNLEFPYKHSTGETVGRFLAGLKEQKKIWGQRVSGQGVVVPPLGYSEIDGSDAGEWVEVKDTGVITAVARVDHPIERLHPFTTPFAFVLVKLDGADTALAHMVKDDLDRVVVGARVQAVWAADEARIGSIRDIECFRVISSVPQPKPAPKPKPAPATVTAAKPRAKKPAKKVAAAKPKKGAKKVITTKRTKATKTAKARKPTKPTQAKKTVKKVAAAKKGSKPATAKRARPQRTKVSRASKFSRAKTQRSPKKSAKTTGRATSKPRRQR